MSENVIEIINDNIILDIADENSDVVIVPENLISIDYTNAVNKPKINSVELVGNKSATALGLVAVESMSAKEDVENKVTALDESSTDTLYPSAKCVRDELLNKANVSLGNLSTAGKAIIDAKADADLSNLSVTGQGVIDAKADTDLSNLSMTGQAVIAGKADVDLNNVNNSGASKGASWAMPSSTYDNLTLGASGTQYTAPSNGWFAVQILASSGGYLFLEGENGEGSIVYSNGNNWTLANFLPTKKGKKCTVSYANYSSTAVFRFIYAQGSENEIT